MAIMNPAKTPITLFGIPNCNTVKLARAWLAEHCVPVHFHDFKKQGVPADLLPGWLQRAGWETLVNRKGTTWRQLDEATRASIVDAASATDLMLSHPSVIKRPVAVWPNGQISVGFTATDFAARLDRS